MPELEIRKSDFDELEKKRKFLLNRAKAVCKYLLSLGAHEVYIFGSVLDPGKFHSHSDVDVAVLDLPDRYVYTVEAKVEDMLETEHFHLIYMEDAPESLKTSIKERGKRYASDIP